MTVESVRGAARGLSLPTPGMWDAHAQDLAAPPHSPRAHLVGAGPSLAASASGASPGPGPRDREE